MAHSFQQFTSESIRQISSALKTDLRAKFYAEAKKLFDLDQSASITNVQGLWMLFMFSCAVGTDRAGSMYRFAAYEMLKRMRLRARYDKLREDVPNEALEKRAITKLYWGIFVLRGACWVVVLLSAQQTQFLTPLQSRVSSIPPAVDDGNAVDGQSLSCLPRWSYERRQLGHVWQALPRRRTGPTYGRRR